MEITPAQEPRRVPGPSRYRLRLRDRRAGALPRQHLPGPARHRRRLPRHPVGDPDRRAARPLAARPQPVQPEEGAGARHRPDRLGQVDDAVGDDRLRQSHPRGPHHHDRGSDRVRAPESEVPGEPARSAHAYAVLQGRAARGPARGSRTSFSSASCATSRPSRSPSRPRRPGTSCSARCTRRRPHRRWTA